MQHFEVIYEAIGNIMSAFPHTPSDRALSLQDYLEDKLANGFELVTWTQDQSSYLTMAFKVVAK